jgi:MinD-like ATPase involved in chromosome partitioning or flagellar assembly
VLRGHYKIGVMGKGGVGKTTVSASVGSVFAELRHDDRVVAIDADTAFGKLGSRVDPKAQGSYWELASDQHLESFADVRSRVGNNAAGLFVLAGEPPPARRRVLDPAIYREATSRLDRHFTISIIDCSSTMDSPVTQEVLRDLDALIVVSSPWVDGAAAAGQTMDWLANRGMTGLLQHTVVVLNDSDGHAGKRTRSILAQQFAGQGQVVIEVPFDGHLRPGGVIDTTNEMSAQTRRRFVEIAAALADHFPSHDDRSRERGGDCRGCGDRRHRSNGGPLLASLLVDLLDQRLDRMNRGGRHRLLGFGADDGVIGNACGLGGFGDREVGATARGIQPLAQRGAGRGGAAHRQFVDSAADGAQGVDQRRRHLADARGPRRDRLELAQVREDGGHPRGEAGVVDRWQRVDRCAKRIDRRDNGLGDQRDFVITGRSRSGRRAVDGTAPPQPGYRAGRPAQHLFELCPGPLARPAAALFEGDERTGIDDAVGRQPALADVEFAPARRCRRPSARHSGIQPADRLIGRLRVGHLTAIPRSMGGGSVSQY